MRLYQTIIIAISFYKLIDAFSALDRKIGRPFGRLMKWLEAILFNKWKGIHTMGFNKSEEDEGIWFFSGTSPAWSLFCPFYADLNELSVMDHLANPVKLSLMKFYKNSLQRMQYAFGGEPIFLIKSVMSSGRIISLQNYFENARFIFILRDPKYTVPSYISMFSKLWSIHSPDIGDNGDLYRDLGRASIEFYKHFHKHKQDISKERLYEIHFESLIKDPIQALKEIYLYFGLNWSGQFAQNLKKEITKSSTYRSKHQYSLEEYGISESELHQELKQIYIDLQAGKLE